MENIIKPLIEIEESELISKKQNLEYYIESIIEPEIEKYYKILEENLDWFLDLKEKRIFEEWLFQNYTLVYKKIFHKYNKLLSYLSNFFLENRESKTAELIDKLNDISLESDNRRGYYYNIKFYHYNESIIDLKDKIKKIINKVMRLEPIEKKMGLGLILPRWSEFEYNLDDAISFNLDFIENKLIVDHNNLYIIAYFIKKKKLRNFWKDGPLDFIEFFKSVIQEITQMSSLKLINIFDITEEFGFNITEIAKKKLKISKKKESIDDILGEGEGQTIEYKETFKWDVKNQNKNKSLKEDVSKAVCAFLNAQGGKVFIGVNDNREVKGIEPDLRLYGNPNRERCKDLLSQELKKTLKDHIDAITINLTDNSYRIIKGHEILEINVAPSSRPVFIFNEDFIVRNGNASIKLEGKSFHDYLVDRFNYGSLDKILHTEEYDEFDEENYIKYPNLKLINEYIELLMTSQMSDDLILRRLDTIYLEFSRLRFLRVFDKESIKTINNFKDLALKFLNLNYANNIKRSLLHTLELLLYNPELEEIMRKTLMENLGALYEENLTERTLLDILIKLGYFNGKLKSELIKAIQKKNINLLENFTSISLKFVEEDKIPIIKELHSISKDLNNDSEKEFKDIIERLIKNLEEG